MQRPLYQVDAFTSAPFAGNPAAVVPLEAWLPDDTLQAVAAENNLSETAYLVPAGPARWELRWFTPSREVPLCGHATLASAFVLTDLMGEPSPVLTFATRQSGDLVVTRAGRRFEMRLPLRPSTPAAGAGELDAVAAVLGGRPLELWSAPADDDLSLIALFPEASSVAALCPDFVGMRTLPARNLIATAPGGGADFVCRVFAPVAGIDEDPVTGSAQCSLVPFWSARTGVATFHARQVSRRGGDLYSRLTEDAVWVAGDAVLYLKGEISLPD